MLNYKKVDILGFDYTIEDLFGHATLFIHSNPYENRRLYKYIDLEHGIDSGGYFELKDARKNFNKKLRELVY